MMPVSASAFETFLLDARIFGVVEVWRRQPARARRLSRLAAGEQVRRRAETPVRVRKAFALGSSNELKAWRRELTVEGHKNHGSAPVKF
jgi:hypothetical protein